MKLFRSPQLTASAPVAFRDRNAGSMNNRGKLPDDSVREDRHAGGRYQGANDGSYRGERGGRGGRGGRGRGDRGGGDRHSRGLPQ